jgi:uncharacterized protein (DUF885 family)
MAGPLSTFVSFGQQGSEAWFGPVFPMSGRRFIVFAALALAACSSHAKTPEKGALSAFFDAEWENEMREQPIWASELGDMRFADQWPDLSQAAQDRHTVHVKAALAQLARLPRAEDPISYDLFKKGLEQELAGERFHFEDLQINQRGGIQTADEVVAELPFKTDADFAAWTARLRNFGRYMDQTIALLQDGVKRGITHPQIVMERVPAQIEKQIVDDPAKSPFFKSGRLETEQQEAIASVVIPAFRRLRAFWATTYLPACKSDVGAWQWPDGDAAYAFLVKEYTTLELTPDQVHAIGLREVGRIRGEMEAQKERAGFKGTTKELFAFLRTDPQFFFKDADSLFAAYKALGDRIRPLLPRIFARLPKQPYTALPVPANVAPDTTTAYYRPGSPDRPGGFMVNLYKPESRPKWEMVALTLHESVPGHHLQIALAQEQTNLPQFRRHASYDVFVEGWALYAERLGDELGLYDDPWSKIGQLTYEMWRAVRLVVDTGIHHLKWDRQRAIDFFMENAPKAELDVVNEIDRYIAWPGQAVAYKIGELKIKELRKKLVPAKLDEKAFHEAILASGPLPLDVLEAHVVGGIPAKEQR